MSDNSYANQALKEKNMPLNSKFALAIIRSLLVNNSGTTFESIESVHSILFDFFFLVPKMRRFPST